MSNVQYYTIIKNKKNIINAIRVLNTNSNNKGDDLTDAKTG
jgi:hypothetical protein